MDIYTKRDELKRQLEHIEETIKMLGGGGSKPAVKKGKRKLSKKQRDNMSKSKKAYWASPEGLARKAKAKKNAKK
jgi:hypothetical protein